MQPFIFCIFYCNYHLCYHYLKVFNPMQITSAMRKMTLLLNQSVCCDDGDRLIVRIDDAFVTFDNFKCLLSPSEYLNGDVNTIYVKKISLYTSIFLYGDSKQNLSFNCRL